MQISSDIVSARGSTSYGSTVHTTMVGVDLRMPMFHSVGTEDLEQHLFMCEVVCTTKQV